MRSITQLATTFPFQSYFDSVLQQDAILGQSAGNPIVDSTRLLAQTPGYGVALHPASRAPVAIRFKGGSADSSIVFLSPGQIVRAGDFTEFEWGLPFGWLGGGPVTLLVLNSEVADVRFPQSNVSLPFHRTRLPILAAIPGSPVYNWPIAFPWSNAMGGVIPQGASPAFNLEPTSTLMRLRFALSSASPAVPATFTLVWTGTDVLDQNSDGTINVTDETTYDVTFSPVSDGLAADYSTAWLPTDLARLGGDYSSLYVIDKTGLYTSAFVDVVRFGRLS